MEERDMKSVFSPEEEQFFDRVESDHLEAVTRKMLEFGYSLDKIQRMREEGS